MAESINLKDLESRNIIEFLARRRSVSNYERMTNEELLSTLKKTSQKKLKLGKRKNNPILTTQPPRKVAKLEINQKKKIAKHRKTQNLTTQKKLKLGKRKNTQNLTYEKPSKLTKRENLTPQKQLKTTKQDKSKNNQQQQIKSKNKERIEVIREQFKELAYKLSKSELNEIKRRLYMVENKKGLLG